MEPKVYLEKIKELVKKEFLKRKEVSLSIFEKPEHKDDVVKDYERYLKELSVINNIYTLFDYMYSHNFSADDYFEIVLNAAAPGITDGKSILQF